MEVPPSQRINALFADIPERGTTDNLLRTAQQHHVALSSMADVKYSSRALAGPTIRCRK